ncbi:hypothetical protein Bca4012_044199 [Brassica carinata]
MATILSILGSSYQYLHRLQGLSSMVCQLRVSWVKDAKKQEQMWESQHEQAADKIYFMCSDLGGFFLKIAQLLAKPDMAPAAWVRKLVTLCDQAPATPFGAVQRVLEEELGQTIDEIFETFDEKPLGSASIAQVHKARVKGNKMDVVVKVQHPGIEKLMMTDIRNLQLFALYVQRTDIKFDLYSITKEMETQIGYEFDFKREANAMERIRHFLYENNKKSPVIVPRALRDTVTKKVLVMEYINGIPILSLGDEMARRGINPHEASHIFLVALLDYGQVKELSDNLRLGYANLVIDIADNNASRVAQSFRELGLHTVAKCENEQQELLRLAQTLFDTKMPAGQTVLQPFADDSSIKKIAVEAFPEELFSVLRTVVLLRGLSVGMGVNYSCAEQWRSMAEEALLASGRLTRDVKRTSRRRASIRSLRAGH